MLRSAAVAAAALSLLLLPSAKPSSSTPRMTDGSGLIRITEKQIRRQDFGFYDVDTGYLRDKHGARIGWSIVICFPLGSGGPLGTGTSYCNSTFNLPLGRIQSLGTRKTRTSYLQAVVGGTGAYSSASGSLLVRSEPYDPTVQLLLFDLT